MVDSIKDDVLDLDTMSDEDFMKLDPSQMEEVTDEPITEGENSDVQDSDDDSTTSNEEASSEDGTKTTELDATSGDDPDSNDADTESGENKTLIDPVSDGQKSEGKPETKLEIPKDEDPKLTDEKSADVDPDKKSEPKTEEAKSKDTDKSVNDTTEAVDFFTKVTASFKADGREMKIRTPEDAIRLMQMGVNYSRRMEEMKPLRAQDQMLKAQGLNDPAKINFLIDLAKGKPEAIKALLKQHNIDPIDIDTSTDSVYQATNYQGDPKDIAFDDALQTTAAAEGGRDLIKDINSNWDDHSKEALRDQPSIFQNVLAQMQSGVYLKIKTELEYQRTMGFLTDVPFLQAYHQVGEAMQKARVFQTEEVQPDETDKTVTLGTGTRKAVQKPKTEQPNPNISSAIPPRSVASTDDTQNEPDYSNMSDEDFMKMAPPG